MGRVMEYSGMLSREDLNKAFDKRFSTEFRRAVGSARVAIAGLGGLGSNVAMMLARSGVGHLLLVDFDTVDVTNLNRQAYGVTHIGQLKTNAMPEILRGIAPYMEINTWQGRVTPDNVKEIFSDYRIIVEAFDDPEQKSMLVDSVLTQCPDAIVVSGNGMAGFGNSNAIQTVKYSDRLYICGDQKTGSGEGIGLTAPRVSICAGHEANKVIELIAEMNGIEVN